MLTSSQRLPLRAGRRETLAWQVLLSLTVHLTLLACLLIIPTTQPPTSGPEPPAVEVVAEEGPAGAGAAPELPALTEATAAPTASAGPDVPPPPSVQQAEIPPPPPPTPAPPTSAVPPPAPTPPSVPTASTAVAAPIAPTPADVPPAPQVQQAENQRPPPAPPPPDVPPPAPAPMPAPTAPAAVAALPILPIPQTGISPPVPVPPTPVAQAPAPTKPPASTQRLATRPAVARAPASPTGASAAVNPGAPARGTEGQNATSRASGANNGAAWMGRLKQWWDQHAFYPKEASQTNEGGDVRVRIVIADDGQVTSIQVVQGSGSSVLDAAALAVFRNARLPPCRRARPRNRPTSW